MPIRTGPTTAIPSLFSAWVDDPQQPFVLEMEVRTIAGRRPEVVKLLLEARTASDRVAGIRTESIRGVQVSKALKLALATATMKISDLGDGLFRLEGGVPDVVRGGGSVARPVRGTPVTEDFLRLVAETYRFAVASGSRRPVADVGRRLGGSRSTAGRWVLQSRSAGFLRPAIGRTAGEAAPKVRSTKGERQ